MKIAMVPIRKLTLMLALGGVLAATAAAAEEKPAATAPPAWWNKDFSFRVPVSVKTVGTDETDAPVQVRLNFSGLLKAGEQPDTDGLRVVEQDVKTGAVIGEVPALRQPYDSPWKEVAALNWQKPYDPAKPPLIRATSENPAHPAKTLIEGLGYWEAGNPTPPWMLAVDLGEARTINAVFPRSSFDGSGFHVPNKLTVEVATESADGLREGNWEKVGYCEQPLMGQYLPMVFPPRLARYVRLTVGGCNNQQPWINALEVYKPFFDTKERAEWRVSWFVPGRTTAERRFYVYFNPLAPGAAVTPPPPLPEKLAVLREAEETINTFHCSGVGFGRTFDSSASGPTNPNILSFFWNADHFTVPAGFAVTIPRPGKYTITLRIRGNPGDHIFQAYYDNKAIFSGAFGIEGEDWNLIPLPAMEMAAGVHYLELNMKLGTGKRPLDFDQMIITDAPDFKPRQCLQAAPGKAEVRP